jgi:hypothetical protein
MKPISLQVTYHRGRPFAAYIYLDRGPGQKSARSEQMAPEIVVDFDANDRPIGVEIISPDSTPVDEVLAVFDRLGLGRPDVAELAPLVAA